MQARLLLKKLQEVKIMTKEQLVEALKAAVGGTPYGDAIVEEAAETYGDKDKKYGQDMKDRLDEKLGVLKAYEKIHRDAGAEAKATAEEDKIAIVEKALKAIE
jgi:ribosomal protein L7/L12